MGVKPGPRDRQYSVAVPGTGTDSPATPSFFNSVGILWRRKLLIILVLLVAVAATAGIDKSRTKQYQSTATLYFLAQGVNASSGASTALSPQQLATDVELVQSAPVQAAVSKSLGVPAPAVSVALVGTTQIADLTVQSTDPTFAAKAANAYATAYITQTREQFVNNQLASEASVQKQINSLQTQIDTVQSELSLTSNKGAVSQSSLQAQLTGLYQQQSALKSQLSQLQLTTAQSSSGAQVVTPAVPSATPSSPKIDRDIGIAIVAGLLVGIGFALLRDNLDDRVRGKDQLEQLMPGIPVLGLIPVIGDWRDRKLPFLVARTRPKSPPSEAYRGLRTSIQFMALENPTKVLQITSPSAGDGKTTTSANLAWIMAEAGQRVVLVGCDLRRPRIHEFFGLPNDMGFTSVLLGEAELEDAVLRVPNQPRLQLLPTGPVPPNPSELLSSAKTREIFKALGAYADIVVVDSAPILPVTDAAVLSANADAVLLVVSAGVDSRRNTVRSIEMLNQINAPLVGSVLNRAPETDSYAYYHYGYGYSEKSSSKENAKTNGKVRAPAANGTGAVVESTTSLDFPNQESGHVEWPLMGRHAKLGKSTPGAPTRAPETGDASSE
jgi:capsular exopolysaccharide synthesis family protein